MEVGTPSPSPRPEPSASEPGEFFATYVEPALTYKWLVLGVALLVGVGTTFWTLQQPRIFDAAATIEYDPNPVRPLGDDVEDIATPGGSFWSSREFFETQNRVLGSRSVAERVVRRLGLHQDPAFFAIPEAARGSWPGASVDEAAIRLQEQTTIQPENGTRLVTIRVRDRDPERAAQLANAIADTYIEKTIEDRLSSTVSALEWLDTQLDTLRSQLNDSELALHHFKQEHNVLSLSMEDRQNLIAGEIVKFSDALTEVRTHRVELSARVARLRSSVGGGEAEDRAAAFGDVASVAGLRDQLRTKLSERDTLALTYGHAHPRIIALDGEIAALREQLGREIDAIVGAAEADLREASETERGLRGLVEQAQQAGLDLNLREIEYQRLNRQRENNQKLYSLVLERSAETDLTRMLRTTHVRIVDRALARATPVSPRVSVNVASGIAAGIVLGLAVAFLLARMDRRLKSTEQVERLGAMVLAAIPIMDVKPEEKQSASAKTASRRREGSARDVVVHDRPMSVAAESFRSLRTNLSFMDVDGDLHAIVVTSAGAEDGKTTVAANLAIAFAQGGKRVLVIDADLRRPRVHLALRVPNQRVGLSTVLIGAATLSEAAVPTEFPGLSVLPCGPIPPNPSELLHHKGFRELIARAKETYDLVIFDSPPVGIVSDAAVIGPQVGGVILVGRVNATARDGLRGALRQFRTVGARVLGVVVNGVDPRRRGYGYGSSYAYGANYYVEHDARDDTSSREAAE